jgi:hypothetical protein
MGKDEKIKKGTKKAGHKRKTGKSNATHNFK